MNYLIEILSFLAKSFRKEKWNWSKAHFDEIYPESFFYIHVVNTTVQQWDLIENTLLKVKKKL